MKKFKVLRRKYDCVLLSKEHGDILCFFVKDIEGDTIYMGYDFDRALDKYQNYDIVKIREEKENQFNGWLKENAEA